MGMLMRVKVRWVSADQPPKKIELLEHGSLKRLKIVLRRPFVYWRPTATLLAPFTDVKMQPQTQQRALAG